MSLGRSSNRGRRPGSDGLEPVGRLDLAGPLQDHRLPRPPQLLLGAFVGEMILSRVDFCLFWYIAGTLVLKPKHKGSTYRFSEFRLCPMHACMHACVRVWLQLPRLHCS